MPNELARQAPSAIELEHCLKQRDQFSLSLSKLRIEQGAITILLGPTGSGKTTLLEILAGVEPWTQGTLRDFDQQSIDPTAIAWRRRIAWVAQRPVLVRGSVADNLAVGLKLRGKVDRRRIQESLETWGLAPLAHRSVTRLSGGQLQLVALARALILEPQLLLLDEPTNGLDPPRTALVEQLVKRQVEERGMTVAWSTHQVFQARRMAHRFALLWNGELLYRGSAQELREPPEVEPMAGFLRGELPT